MYEPYKTEFYHLINSIITVNSEILNQPPCTNPRFSSAPSSHTTSASSFLFPLTTSSSSSFKNNDDRMTTEMKISKILLQAQLAIIGQANKVC